MAYYIFRLDTGEIIAASDNITDLRSYFINANGVTYEDAPLRDWQYLTVSNGDIVIDTEEWAADRRATRDLLLVCLLYTSPSPRDS